MIRSLAVLCCVGWLASCTPLQYIEAPANSEAEIKALHAQLLQNPQKTDVLRDLGAIYIRTRRLDEGYEYLTQAYQRGPDDPKTLFYMGLVTEMRTSMLDALPYYERYRDFPSRSSYRKLMEGRYTWLRQELIRNEMIQRVAQEAELTEEAHPDVLAVFPFQFFGGDLQYEPLGRGMSEMVTVDLSQVNGLRVVERARLQAVLDELQLSQQAAFEPSSAPRLGRLLGAGRIVGGNFSVLDNDALRVDLAAWMPLEDSSPVFEGVWGDLQDLFTLEKEIVFKILFAMNIELTPLEQRQIERIPTQNMQAFLAYSNGLLMEDSGYLDEALTYYQSAMTADPAFRQAQAKSESVQNAIQMSGSASDALNKVNELDAPLSSPVDLLSQRILMLEGGGSFGPGNDERSPATEAAIAGDGILPAPPAPPANQ